MIFSSPEPVLISNCKTYFTVKNSILVDPFQRIDSIGNNRILIENSYYPFLYLKGSGDTFDSLVFYVHRDNLNIIAWKVKDGKEIKFIDQTCISVNDFILILPLLINFEFDELQNAIRSSIKNIDIWAKQLIEKILGDLNRVKKLEELLYINSDSISKSIWWLTSSYVGRVNCSRELVLEFIKKEMQDLEARKIYLFFQKTMSRLRDNFNCHFSKISKYCILREIVCLITGRHIVLDPFTFKHTLSDSCFLYSIDNYHYRLIKYKSTAGYDFIERRGPGWIDITSSIIFPNGLIIESRAPQQHGPALKSEEIEFIKKLFDSSTCLDQEKEYQYLMIDVDYNNFGHILWNEVSGYVEFALSCKESEWQPKKVIPILPSLIPNSFSKLGPRHHLFPYIKKSLDTQIINEKNDSIILNYINSIKNIKITNELFVKNQPISFRFPVLSKLVSNTISNDFKNIEKSKINIYINVRFHNKSQTNLIECLSELFKQLENEESSRLKPSNMEINLEFFDDLHGIINEINTICNKYKVKINTYKSCEIQQLMEIVSKSDICISPIGSGAVFPTWIFNKYTVLHSEQAHLYQMEWWTEVGNMKKEKIFVLPRNSIHDFSGTAGLSYSNYTIDPNSYALVIINAIKAYAFGTSNSYLYPEF